MNIKELLRQADKLGRNYDAIFLLLRDASYEILNGRGVFPLKTEDIVKYLNYAIGTAAEASDYGHVGTLTDEQDKLMDEIARVGWRIIEKYDIQDPRMKSWYLTLNIMQETDPDKLSKMRKKLDELDDQVLAMD